MELVEVYKSLEAIFIKIVGDENLHINESTTTDDIPGWSSLVQTHLVVEIERCFNCRLTLRDIMKIKKNISTIADLITEKVN